MQLTIKATGENVQVLSYLLAKNPTNLYERSIKGHSVRLFYSTFEEKEVEVTIFVAPDPIELLDRHSNQYEITHYINDREFAVSSIFCSFIRTALGTALNGQPKEEYADWVNHAFPFQITVGPVSSELTDQQIEGLFKPLGYETLITHGSQTTSHAKSARMITLNGMTTLQNGLRQLFVLIPVLDNYKHYYIDEKEVEKLKRYGQGWLDDHPMNAFIIQRALRFKELYEGKEETKTVDKKQKTPSKTSLAALRYEKILNTVSELKNKETIVDMGSGEGKLSVKLGFLDGVKEILAVEPSEQMTLQAIKRFEKLEGNSGFLYPTLIWGSLFYYDERLKDKDCLILCEVIEHIDEIRLPKIMKMIFEEYRPKSLIITTPNKEYNTVYDLNDHYRHSDHRFEWSRIEFSNWCHTSAANYPYELQFDQIGETHEQYGSPTQMCLFIRKEGQLNEH